MANLKRVKTDGYGQVELNRCAFPRDGRVEAQCYILDENEVENGAILAIDKWNKNCVPLYRDYKDSLWGLCYTTEHTQSATKTALKDFVNKPRSYPRLGLLDKGDLFTTNTLAYYDDDFAQDSDLFAANVKDLKVGIVSMGVLTLYKGAPHDSDTNMIKTNYKVVKWTTMPDGQRAAQIMVM